MKVFYAVQTCDSHFNIVSSNDRIVKVSKSDLIKVCLVSFMESVKYAADKDSNVDHIIKVFDDRSSDETLEFLKELKLYYSNKNVLIDSIVNLETPGIMNSIRKCYEWLTEIATYKDLVYQVQDDYLFEKSAIFEMIDVYFQMRIECETNAIISPHNATSLWASNYRNRSTPRTIICGRERLWIQCYDTSCSFLTNATNIKNQWVIFEKFLSLPPDGGDTGDLENISLNYLFTRCGILGLIPINSLAIHTAREQDIDLYANWEDKWVNASRIAEENFFL